MQHRRRKPTRSHASRKIKTGVARRRVKRRVVRGKGIGNWLINALPVELHYRGFDTGFKPYNFAGPGTKLDQRLDKNGNPLPHSRPVNRVDHAAYEHDKFYEKHRDHATRKHGDNVMIDRLAEVRKDKNGRWTERADAAIVEGLMRTKRFLGLGKKRRRRVLPKK